MLLVGVGIVLVAGVIAVIALVAVLAITPMPPIGATATSTLPRR